MIRQKIKIINKLGLHARAASKFVALSQEFSAEISVCMEAADANGKSIMSMLMLGAPKDSVIELKIEGEDEEKALSALIQLIENKFDEPE